MSDAIGPTGEFPDGKLNDADEGALNVAVAHDEGKVYVQLGAPIEWFAMHPQGAADFASCMLKHARAAALQAGVVINFTVPGAARSE